GGLQGKMQSWYSSKSHSDKHYWTGDGVNFALTYHVEGPQERPSLDVYEEIAAQVELADRLGFDYAWFAEHHAHIHLGHLPCPLLFALHLASRTRRIHLGTAVI